MRRTRSRCLRPCISVQSRISERTVFHHALRQEVRLRVRYQARVDARRMASSERVTSSSVVDQLLTEIRSTRRPCQVDPLIQAVPSWSSLAST